MLSFLIGSPAPSWYDLRDMFEDYKNVAVYTDFNGNIEMIKVSDIDEFFLPTSVILHPEYLVKLKVCYLKMRKYVAFPVFNLNAIKKLVENKNWRAIEYYEQDQFKGGWVLYDCDRKECEEKQMSHLMVNPLADYTELISKHLRIYQDG